MSFQVSWRTIPLSFILIFVSEVYKKVKNIKIYGVKVFPEKPYELAQSYELAPYELAQHPCIINFKFSHFIRLCWACLCPTKAIEQLDFE